ncbi:MAG: C4-type zinc ribbon domain-containing protein [Anaerolineaceae bacterium]
MNTTFNLFQLQKIDTESARIQNRLNEINRLLQDDSGIKSAVIIFEAAKKKLHEDQVNLKSLEELIRAKRNKVEQSESSLYEGKIKNPKELQDLQKEIAAIKSSISTMEEEELELMLRIEAEEEACESENKKVQEAQKIFEDKNHQLIQEKESLQTSAQKIAKERLAILSQLTDDFVSVYDNLRVKKSGVAIALIEEQTCTCCGTTLTPADVQSARTMTRLVYCPTCGRILYAG